MRSYLSSLALRAVQQPQSIRPRVASFFESSGPRVRLLEPIGKKYVAQPRRASETGNEQSETATLVENIAGREAAPQISYESRPAVIRRVVDLPSEIKPDAEQTTTTPVRGASRQPEANREPTSGQQKAETSDRPKAGSHPVAIQGEPARAEPPAAIEIIEETDRIEPGPEPAASGPMTAASQRRREPSLHAGVIVRPELAASEAKAAAFEAPLPSQEAPQSIRITIGRVDVRAIMPQPATATKEARKATTAGPMSLDEYLKKRSGAQS